jgi:hypothetical protein
MGRLGLPAMHREVVVTIVEFLRTWLSEDEKSAQVDLDQARDLYEHGHHATADVLHVRAARALWDIEAKRRIAAAWRPVGDEQDTAQRAAAEALDMVVRWLTAPYWAHPDYDRRWQPRDTATAVVTAPIGHDRWAAS